MARTAFYAMCLRKWSIEIAEAYAAKLDATITPNQNAVRTMIESIENQVDP